MATIKLQTELALSSGNEPCFTFSIEVPQWLKEHVRQNGAFIRFQGGFYDWQDDEPSVYWSPEKPKNDEKYEEDAL